MNSKAINKKHVEVVLFIIVFVASIIATTVISTNYLMAHQETYEPKTVECTTYGENHFVYISENRFYPKEINAEVCDLMTIINHDRYRLLAFGQHDNHIEYSGFYEEPLKKDAAITVELSQTGSYMLHDHLQDYVYLSFTVAE